ncbi:antibiotic biosynthesis monooxygenase [uncultured Hoeflea sp.]|uniref:antibiotic biosynthesis monooxygenase family protein n=1 Tax=uncultured Hoeflea sp. TaxID=538666 RepID=UPI0030D8A2AD
MFIAMNRFIINEGFESAFEDVWRNRDSSLKEVPGFQTFHLLKGPKNQESGQTLYASHTVWATHDDFVDWTNSEHFRNAHKNAGNNKGMYAGHPNFEGFEAVLDA